MLYKLKIKQLRQIILDEIKHSEECKRRNTRKQDIDFWTGANVQAKEIYEKFNQLFNK